MRPFNQQGFSLIEVIVVIGAIAVISAMTIPFTSRSIQGRRVQADAQTVNGMIGLAKMRASSGFTRARVRANLGERTLVLEQWDKDDAEWVQNGGVEVLSDTVAWGFGGLDAPPPDTQVNLEQSPPCRIGLDAASDAIDGTACVVFNSRGLPIDGGGLLYGGHALYLTDGSVIWGTTITATPRIRLWSTSSGAAAEWGERQ